jgi:hypothetical protein
MVQSAQDRGADDIPGPLNVARDRGILVQGQAQTAPVITVAPHLKNLTLLRRLIKIASVFEQRSQQSP